MTEVYGLRVTFDNTVFISNCNDAYKVKKVIDTLCSVTVTKAIICVTEVLKLIETVAVGLWARASEYSVKTHAMAVN